MIDRESNWATKPRYILGWSICAAMDYDWSWKLEPSKVRHPNISRHREKSRHYGFPTRVKLLVIVTLYSFTIFVSVASITVEVTLYCTMPADIRSFFGGKPTQSNEERTPAKVEVRIIISCRPSYLSIHLQCGLFNQSSQKSVFTWVLTRK